MCERRSCFFLSFFSRRPALFSASKKKKNEKYRPQKTKRKTHPGPLRVEGRPQRLAQRLEAEAHEGHRRRDGEDLKKSFFFFFERGRGFLLRLSFFSSSSTPFFRFFVPLLNSFLKKKKSFYLSQRHRLEQPPDDLVPRQRELDPGREVEQHGEEGEAGPEDGDEGGEVEGLEARRELRRRRGRRRLGFGVARRRRWSG